MTDQTGPVAPGVPGAQAMSRGIYPTPGRAKEISFWTGAEWDARPVAPTWTRVWCNVVDGVLATVLFFVLAMGASALLLVTGSEPSGQQGSSPLENAVFTSTLIVSFLGYFTVSYKLWGRTPGMMLGQLYVVRIVGDTTRMSWSDSFLRALVLCIGYTCGIMAIIWLTITASSRTKQGPHDSAAKTVVLVRRRGNL